MAKDNVLVRKINGLETAGSLSILFSDKTGTITEGRLSVVEMATGNVRVFDSLAKMTPALAADVVTGIGVNNSAVASNGQIIGGNSTDRALMAFLVDAKADNGMSKEDVRNFNAFDSAKKYSSVTLVHDGKSVTYTKGAPEKIIEKCSHYIDENGNVKELVEKNYLTTYIDAQAGRSMRLLAVAKADGDNDSANLTLICVISIRDNVRKEAADAIKEVQNARKLGCCLPPKMSHLPLQKWRKRVTKNSRQFSLICELFLERFRQIKVAWFASRRSLIW